MTLLDNYPLWAVALVIFGLRVVDVSLGTLRTIAVVHGRVALAVAFGFFEVLVWLLAVAHVLARVGQEPVLVLAFAAGYAAGNGAGVVAERWMALGNVVLRIISSARGQEVAAALRSLGQRVTSFEGQGRDGARTLLYATCARRDLDRVMSAAHAVDPELFYVVEHATRTSPVATLAPFPGLAWRPLARR